MYVYEEFPKWKYHPDKPAVVVANIDEETRLGQDWFDHPDQAKEAKNRLQSALKKAHQHDSK